MASTEITVQYRSKDGWHLFTSDQILGLFVASPDMKVAFSDIPETVRLLLKLDYGLDCVVQPKLEYEAFLRLTTLRNKAQNAVSQRTRDMLESLRVDGSDTFRFMVGSCQNNQAAT